MTENVGAGRNFIDGIFSGLGGGFANQAHARLYDAQTSEHEQKARINKQIADGVDAARRIFPLQEKMNLNNPVDRNVLAIHMSNPQNIAHAMKYSSEQAGQDQKNQIEKENYDAMKEMVGMVMRDPATPNIDKANIVVMLGGGKQYDPRKSVGVADSIIGENNAKAGMLGEQGKSYAADAGKETAHAGLYNAQAREQEFANTQTETLLKGIESLGLPPQNAIALKNNILTGKPPNILQMQGGIRATLDDINAQARQRSFAGELSAEKADTEKTRQNLNDAKAANTEKTKTKIADISRELDRMTEMDEKAGRRLFGSERVKDGKTIIIPGDPAFKERYQRLTELHDKLTNELLDIPAGEPAARGASKKPGAGTPPLPAGWELLPDGRAKAPNGKIYERKK